MTTKKSAARIALLSLLLLIYPGGLISQTGQVRTIRVRIDPQLDKGVARSTLSAVFQMALQHQLDVRAKIIDADAAQEFTPPKPLSLSDFPVAGLANVIFKDSRERQVADERRNRLEATTGAFDAYFARYAGLGGSCVKLVRTAQ